MAHLFLRKCFKKKYETPDELFNDLSAEIEIDPALKDAPIFLEAAPGGWEFAVPEKAAMSRSAYAVKDALGCDSWKPNKIELTALVSSSGGAANTNDLNSVRSWANNLAKAQASIPLLDLDDGPATTVEQQDQDRLFDFLIG
ncbi:hypothetical protein B0H13DRAFT_2374892 [Mycena leptocephala]|nr:hypothetical protein B0H13DRAFT_2374892 [Mycena leptocephala]